MAVYSIGVDSAWSQGIPHMDMSNRFLVAIVMTRYGRWSTDTATTPSAAPAPRGPAPDAASSACATPPR
jgi:hypothetical protein